MFAIAHMSDVVRIPPSKLTNSLKLTAIGILKEKYESMVSSDLGYVILIHRCGNQRSRQGYCWGRSYISQSKFYSINVLS